LGQPRAALAQAGEAPAVIEPEADVPRTAKGDAQPRAADGLPRSEMFGYPDYTGSMSKTKPKPAEQPAETPKSEPNAADPPVDAKSKAADGVMIDPNHPMI